MAADNPPPPPPGHSEPLTFFPVSPNFTQDPLLAPLNNHNLCSKIVKKFKPRFVAWAKPNVSDPINRLIDDLSKSESASLLRQGGRTLTTSLVRALLMDRSRMTPVRYIAYKLMVPSIVRSFKYFRHQLRQVHPDPELLEDDHLYALWAYLSNSREVHRAISAHSLFQRVFGFVLRGTGITRLLDNGIDMLWDLFSLVMASPMLELHDLPDYANPKIHGKQVEASLRYTFSAYWATVPKESTDPILHQVAGLFISCLDTRAVWRVDYTAAHTQALETTRAVFNKLAVIVDGFHEEKGPHAQGIADVAHGFATFIAAVLDTPAFWLAATITLMVKALSTNNRIAASAYMTAASLCVGMLVSTGIHCARHLVDILLNDKAFSAADFGFFSRLVGAFKPIYKEIALRIPLSPPADEEVVAHFLPSVHGENPLLQPGSHAFDMPTLPPSRYDAEKFLADFLKQTGLTLSDLTDSLSAPNYLSFALPSARLNDTGIANFGFVHAHLAHLKEHQALPPWKSGLPLDNVKPGDFRKELGVRDTPLGRLWTMQAAINVGYAPSLGADDREWHFTRVDTVVLLKWQAELHAFLHRHGIKSLFDAYVHEESPYSPTTGFMDNCDPNLIKGLLGDQTEGLLTDYLNPVVQYEGAGVPFLNFFVSLAGAFGKTISPGSLARYGQQFSSLWRAFTDGRALIDYVTPFFTMIVNALAGLLGYPPLFVNHLEKAVEFVTDYNARITNYRTVSLSSDPDISGTISEVEAMCENLPELEAYLAHIPAKETIHKDANLMKINLQKLIELLVAQDAASRPRCEPVCILLPGAPGIGKSQFSHFLTKSLMRVETSNGPQAYLRNDGLGQIDLNANFQDSIRDQATWMLDEFLTLNDSTTRKAHVDFVLSNVNCTQKLVEKAAIEDKAKYWVSNQMLILTTNSDIGVVKNLVPNVGALLRRIDLVVDINPPPHVDGRFPTLADGSIDWTQFAFDVRPFDMATMSHPTVPELTQLTAVGVVQKVATLLANRGRDYSQSLHSAQAPRFRISRPSSTLPPPCIPEVHIPSIMPRTVLTDKLPPSTEPTVGATPYGTMVTLPRRFPDAHDTRLSEADMDQIVATWNPAVRMSQYKTAITVGTGTTGFWATLAEVAQFGLPQTEPADRAAYEAYMADRAAVPVDWKKPDDWQKPFLADRERAVGGDVWYSDTTLAFAALSIYARRAQPWKTGDTSSLMTPWTQTRMAASTASPPISAGTASSAPTSAPPAPPASSASASSSAPLPPPSVTSVPPPPASSPSPVTAPSSAASSSSGSAAPPAASGDDTPTCQGNQRRNTISLSDLTDLAIKLTDPDYPRVPAAVFYDRLIWSLVSREEVTSLGCYPLYPIGVPEESYTFKLAIRVRLHFTPSKKVETWIGSLYSYGAEHIVSTLRSLVTFDGIRQRLKQLTDFVTNGLSSASSSLLNRGMNLFTRAVLHTNMFMSSVTNLPVLAFEKLTGKQLSFPAAIAANIATAVFLIVIGGVALGLAAYGIYKAVTAPAQPSRDTTKLEFNPPTRLEHQGIRYGSGDQERFRDQEIHKPRRRPGHRHRHGATHGPLFGGTAMNPNDLRHHANVFHRSGPEVRHNFDADPPYVQGADTRAALAVRGICWFTTSYGDSYRAFGVYAQMVVMPHHYLFAFRADPIVTYSDARVTVKLDIRKITFAELPERDLLFMWLPNTVPAFPDITHRFIDEDDLDKFPNKVEFHAIGRSTPHTSHVVNILGVPIVHRWTIRVVDEDEKYNGLLNYMGLAVVTAMARQVGDCGSVYTVSSPELESRCIVGIHVAGNASTSYCSVVTNDMLCDAIDSLVTHDDSPVCQGPLGRSPRERPPATAYSDPDGDENVVTVVDAQGTPLYEHSFEAPLAPHTGSYQSNSRLPENIEETQRLHLEALENGQRICYPPSARYIGRSDLFIRSSNETRYVPGPLAPYLTPPGYSEGPALLKPTDGGVNPLDNALKRQVHLPIVELNVSLMAEAAEAVFSKMTRHAHRRTWTIEEAIAGRGSLGQLESSAAPGTPWDSYAANMHKPAQKGTFYEIRRERVPRRGGSTREQLSVDIHPTLRTAVERAVSLLEQGLAPDWMMKCALKDEIVPEEKITIGKTRMYYVAPIDHAIVCRMLFGDLIAQTMIDRTAAPCKVSCSVGLAPNDGVLRAFHTAALGGDVFPFAADQKGWDNHQHYAIASFLADAINNWYKKSEDPKTKVARTTFIKSCYNSLFVLNGVVYRMPFGLPSGVAFTSQMNSWYLEAVTLYAAYKALPPTLTPKPTINEMKNEIFALYYGDDSWVLFPACWRLTSSAIFDQMTRLGLEATHSIKDWPREKEVPYDQQTFLKRTLFKNTDGILVWALPKATLEGQFMWILRKHVHSQKVLMGIIASHFEEVALHGEEYFKERVEVVSQACREHGVEMTVSTLIHSYSQRFL